MKNTRKLIAATTLLAFVVCAFAPAPGYGDTIHTYWTSNGTDRAVLQIAGDIPAPGLLNIQKGA